MEIGGSLESIFLLLDFDVFHAPPPSSFDFRVGIKKCGCSASAADSEDEGAAEKRRF